jgi:hypothetical protein
VRVGDVKIDREALDRLEARGAQVTHVTGLQPVETVPWPFGLCCRTIVSVR